MSTMTRQVVYVVPDVTEPAGGVLTASDRPGLGLEFHPAVFPA